MIFYIIIWCQIYIKYNYPDLKGEGEDGNGGRGGGRGEGWEEEMSVIMIVILQNDKNYKSISWQNLLQEC